MIRASTSRYDKANLGRRYTRVYNTILRQINETSKNILFFENIEAMEKFTFTSDSSENNKPQHTFNGSYFYHVYKDAEFLRIDANIEMLLGRGYELRKKLKNSVQPGNVLLVDGMNLERKMEATNLALSPRESLKPRSEHKTLQLSGKPNQVGTVLLYGVPIVSLVIEGNERLCLAQISNTLLKQFSYNEIHNRRVALGITCVQCTPVQLEILRRAGAMPVSSRRCGMITRREAERLCKSFLGDNAPPRLPDDFAFAVHHECAWGCRGAFLPARYNSSRAKCIKCAYCGLFFSPNKFIFHSHRVGPGDKYIQPDAANFNSWRRHMKLSGTPPEEVVHAWEDVKAMFNGGTRKRMLSAARPESEGSSEAKRPAASPPSAHAPVPRLADYVWGARLPLPYALPWLKPTLWTPGALTALSSVNSIEEPRAFRPVRGHRLESPQLSPVMSPPRSPNRSPVLSSPLRSSHTRSPLRSPPPSSPARSPKSDRDSDESVDIETTEEDQPRDVPCTWPCNSVQTPRPDETCWSGLVPKVERDEEARVEPWRLPDLRPSLHYMHDRDRDCVACVAPLPLLPPPAPAPH